MATRRQYFPRPEVDSTDSRLVIAINSTATRSWWKSRMCPMPRRFRSRRLQLQPVVGVTSEASRHTARTATAPAPGTSWTPAPSSSWSAFRSVAPSSKKARSQSEVREIKKSVDLWSMEVVRNKLQLAEVRSLCRK